ncbi:MAG: ligase-associated DNA damage response endonuclease PdeM [Limisphaerales bacterium]
MKNGAHKISWANEELTLLPERALWWARQKTMFIADLHLGKAATFRNAGIAVPETGHDDDLERLEKILKQYGAERLVVLGDFFHAKSGRTESTLTAFKNWRDRHPSLEMTLVIGNHDRHAGVPPDDWRIRCVTEPWTLPPFSCYHKPLETMRKDFALCGHVHPAFELYERSGLRAKSVCFYFQERIAILPAFGSFTGTHVIKPLHGEKFFLVVEGQIVDASGTVK